MEKDSLYARIHNRVDEFGSKFYLTVNDNRVTFDRNNLAGVLVDKIFSPGIQNPCGEFASDNLFEGSLRNLDFVGEVENLENVFVALETNSTEQSGNGQLLFAVDVGVHHIVDVGSELDPRSFERNNTC